MMRMRKGREYGFTLVELLLVSTIISGMLIMGLKYQTQRAQALRIDRTSAQMQQILNAGLTYYVNNGFWPANLAALQPTYLPATILSPWGTTYTVTSTNPVLTVSVSLPAGIAGGTTIGQILAGTLPLASTTTVQPPTPVTVPPAPPAPTPPATTTIQASVNIPGQNLNNMGNVSFAGMYHNGGCIPVPTCPTTDPSGATLTPQVMLAPASVSGMNDPPTTASYPIISFTARSTAIGDAGTPAGVPACPTNADISTKCYSDVWGTTQITSGKYWRACLYVVTSKGDVTWDSTTGQYATVMAVTRCGISAENAGSSFNVWAP